MYINHIVTGISIIIIAISSMLNTYSNRLLQEQVVELRGRITLIEQRR